MTDYEVRLERCKREDTKELVIQCLDKASIDNAKQMHDENYEVLEALGVLGAIFVGIVIFAVIMNKVFE